MRATRDGRSGWWASAFVALLVAGPVLLIPSVAAADHGPGPGTSVSSDQHGGRGDEQHGGGSGQGGPGRGGPGQDDAHRVPAPTAIAPQQAAAPPVTATPTAPPSHSASTPAARTSARRSAATTSPAAAVPPVGATRSAAAGKVATAGPGGPRGSSALLASAVAAGVLVFVLGLLAAGARTLARMKSVEQ